MAPNSKNGTFLIVGQGIAGTLLAYFLFLKKQPFRIVDRPMPGAASSIAAGIINPITGRRMVKSWRFNQLAAHARITYHDLGQWLGITVLEDKNILRALPDIFTENEWERRSSFPENEPFFCQKADPGPYLGKVKPVRAWGELTGAAKLDMPRLIKYFRKFLNENGLLEEELFDFEKLQTNRNRAIYKGQPFEKIIFCEGAKATHNPFFNYLPHAPSKGELLLVKIKGLNARKMLKNKIYLVPLGKDIFWAGPTNEFIFENEKPTAEKGIYLKNTLSAILDTPFEIVAHHAGIRPTVADKRPLLGQHPEYPPLCIFNGLGTKGASLAPLFAQQMANFLMLDCPLNEEVNIGRFNKSSNSPHNRHSSNF